MMKELSLVNKTKIVEIDRREAEYDIGNVKDPTTWNPLKLKSTDVYKNTSLASIRKKILLKEVELTIKIEGEATQIVGLNVFTIEDLAKFKKYASDKKYSYVHFGGIRIGLAPLF